MTTHLNKMREALEAQRIDFPDGRTFPQKWFRKSEILNLLKQVEDADRAE